MLGVAALLLSTKYEEIYPPDLKDLLSISENKFTKEEVLQMEFQILKTLQFNFFAPSSLRFLERYRKLSNTASDD
jgi:cyclin B